jgi:hypothetical protein
MLAERDNLTEFEFHDYRGWLFVSLERAAFEKVFKALQQNAEGGEISEIDISEVWQILVYDSSRNPKSSPRSRWKDRLLLFGYGLVAFLVAFVLVMGILAIIGLVPLPR